MGNYNSYLESQRSKGIISVLERPKSTTEVYSEIKNLDLETVIWNAHKTLGKNELEEISSFLEKNKPCLFIYDPIEGTDAKKGYLFGIEDMMPIIKWISSNIEIIEKYTFLTTTQITNPGNGFVGTVYSDGNGNISCESLHTHGISNHRKLSQMDEMTSRYLDFFMIDDHRLEYKSAFNLDHKSLLEIQSIFEDKIGYFEFVKGMQSGKEGIYTTGYEKFDDNRSIRYPYGFHERYPLKTIERINAIVLENYL